MEYERVKNVYVLRNSMLERTKPNMRILHPLPRVGEIDPDVDRNPKAYYFQQTENGVYTRMPSSATYWRRRINGTNRTTHAIP